MEAKQEQVEIQEAVELGATDGAFFGEFFLPKTFRLPSPRYARTTWDSLDDPNNRNVGIQIFRGGGKTTILRAFTLKRICYGISHTIVYVGKSQSHALNSVAWIMRQIETNRTLAQTFQLRKGKKWTSEYCEIYHGVDKYPIGVLALGIEGSVRGINVDDWRPDLIVLDDVIDDENAATIEQRQKITNRIFGAIEKSLAKRSEQPHAKMVMLQTPLDRDDASELVQNDPQWHPLKFSCFGPDGKSAWEEMFPLQELLEDKQSHIRRNMLSLWMREMECKVVGDEKRYFSLSWLNIWTIYPDNLTVSIGVDPSPPKDEDPEKRKKKDPDPEVLAVCGLGRYGNIKRRYILEIVEIQDPNPEKTTVEFNKLARTWHPLFAAVETVAYQKTLKWYIEKAMDEKRCARVPIESVDDKRSKIKRIRQFFTQACDSNEGSELYYHHSMKKFADQFQDYPDVSHDDILDAVTIGFSVLEPFEGVTLEGEYERFDDEDDIPALEGWRAAP